MLDSEIEFEDCGDFYSVYYENDLPPFDDKLMGAIRKDDSGYYRFHPARKSVMTCKHLRVLTEKISELNT